MRAPGSASNSWQRSSKKHSVSIAASHSALTSPGAAPPMQAMAT